MIKHIVMWSLKEEYNGQSKNTIAKELKTRLLELENKIPQIKSIEVGINEVNFDRNHDVVLITEFDSFDDLSTYANHPDHLNLVEFVKQISTARAAIDFTL
ncbi:MAG: stress responsive protein [Bacteroidetes bacterium HGW-Bacteroidetes-19]|nr:MAG: stress responsive protein [Bacteroidetes bacterium HGW-Bacteroidetes-19]